MDKTMIRNKLLERTIVRLAAAGLLLCSLGAQAENIVYQVDRVFGGATVFGTIETDGTIGPLAPENIKSWSLQADDGSGEHAPITIGSATGGGLTGDNNGWSFFSATSSELVFDFDGAYAVGPIQGVQFFGGGADFSVNYAFGAGAEFGFGKKENLVHFFDIPPVIGLSHYAEALRTGTVIIARVDIPVVDCSAPAVSLGEVMAGFQSGFVAGTHNEYGPAGDYFLAANGEDRRGFVVPEGLVENDVGRSAQCENDFILISGFAGSTIEFPDGTKVRTPKDAIDIVNAGLDGFIVYQRFELDRVLVEQMNTAPKIGYMPNGRRAAIIASGIIIEPYSLSQGNHSAVVTYGLDFDCRLSRGGVCDGIADFDLVYSAPFFVNPAN
jgi:hypothetical protein